MSRSTQKRAGCGHSVSRPPYDLCDDCLLKKYGLANKAQERSDWYHTYRVYPESAVVKAIRQALNEREIDEPA